MKYALLVLATIAAAGAAHAKDLNLAVRTAQAVSPNNSENDAIAFCNAGEVATGGGVQLGTGGVAGAYITSTKPYVSNGKVIGWEAIVTNQSGADLPTTWYAVCQH